FAFGNLAETARTYATQLQRLRDTRYEQITDTNRSIDDGVYVAVSDPRQPTLAPTRRDAPPQFNFAPLLNAVDSLSHAASRYDRAFTSGTVSASAAASLAGRSAAIKSINMRLLQAERSMTSNDGLKGRSWYRHMLYAPGFYTGYGVKTMPGAREAIEQGSWTDVNAEILRIASALNREAALVSKLAGDFGTP
ncbi:MAG: transferrin receptor-like dimerization domain-containing protein, partial [Gemmatimonadaceae bacterium]